MSLRTVFTIAYWLGYVVEIVIRAPLNRRRKALKVTERRYTGTEKLLLGLLSFGGLLIPLIYSVTPWLDFADYTLPAWMGWLGVILVACAVYIFALGHRDLAANWSPTLEIFEDHKLVTTGIYRHIRDPMYASQWVYSIAQILLLQNWIAGPAGLIVFIPFYILRVRAEEKMMLVQFGDEYREYRDHTSSVIPKL
jgi:protein-S-isoprenylcysteine O-methyltransferase Ste14